MTNKDNNSTETQQDSVQANGMDKLINKYGNKVEHSLNSAELVEADNTDKEHYLWKPGQSGNPNGRPKGVRNAISEQFLRDLHDVWNQETTEGSTTGLDVIRSVADSDPAKLLAAMVQVLPKDFQVNVTEHQQHWVINCQPGYLSTSDWLSEHGLIESQPVDSQDKSD